MNKYCSILLLLVFGNMPIFAQQNHLKLDKITPNNLQFSWMGPPLQNIRLHYGKGLDFELGSSQSLNLEGLEPASFYYVQARAELDGQTIHSEPALFSTASLSSGDIHVYFNNSVNNAASTIADAIHLPDFTDTLVAYLNRAQYSLDICNYNTGSARVVAAINAAQSRGIAIRYIASHTELGNNDQLGNLSANIPLIQRPNDGEVMHNKFVVIDAAYAALAKVITGSANHTDGSLADDYNNLLIVEDQALALAYKTEFEEMWGSTGSSPNAANAKFGAAKTDNTPHLFSIGGKQVELYFSPSDGTTAHIETALRSAHQDLSFAMLTFINNDLGDAVIDKHQAGVNCRGIIENILYIGSEYTGLQNAGVDVHSHFTTPYLLHHKYGVVDATNINSDPLVITGSHNWTNSAESDYDENTLIIHDASIANMFYEEFSARYNDLVAGVRPIKNGLLKLYPNPCSELLNIETENVIESLTLYNNLGQYLTVPAIKASNGLFTIDLGAFAAGIYTLVIIDVEGSIWSQKIVLQR